MRRLLSIIAAAAGFGMALEARGGDLECAGVRLVRDADFYGSDLAEGLYYLPRHDEGSHLQVYFRNTGSVPIRIENYALNGIAHEDLPDYQLDKRIPSTKWWFAWPNPVAPGALTTVRIHLCKSDQSLGKQTQFTLATDKGKEVFPLKPRPTALWMPFIYIGQDMQSLIVYAANQGGETLRLPADGGFSVDLQPKAGSPMQTELAPGAMTPIRVKLPRPLRKAGHVLFQLTTADGKETASGSMRAFPSEFGATFWNLGTGLDTDYLDLKRHNIDINIANFEQFQDEPHGHSVTGMMLIERVLKMWEEHPERPLMSQFTGYYENLIYGDIVDRVTTHHGAVQQDLSMYLSWPKPVWYLPQDCWGRMESATSLTARESWYPLDDLYRQAVEAIGYGAKNIQWFTYMNLYDRGYGAGPGWELGRMHQDFFMPSAIGNPLIWDRVGRSSGVLMALKPYLIAAAPFEHHLEENGISVSTVLSGTDKAVVALADYRTPGRFYQRGGLRQEVLTYVPVRVKAPEYLKISKAWELDPFAGVGELGLRQVAPGTLELMVRELRGAGLILLGDAADESTLRQNWRQISAGFGLAEGAAATFSAAAESTPREPWQEAGQNRFYRIRVTARNDGNDPAEVLALKAAWPRDMRVAEGSLRVVEITDQGGKLVPHHAPFNADYETFQGPALERLETTRDENHSPILENGVFSYRATRPGENYKFPLRFKNPQPWGQTAPGGWISPDWTRVVLEMDVERFPHVRGMELVIERDENGDGQQDSETRLPIQRGEPRRLPDGWVRYSYDVDRTSERGGASTARPAAPWRFWIETAVTWKGIPDEKRWSLRYVGLERNTLLTLKPTRPLAPRESRTFELYFNDSQAGAAPRQDTLLADAQPVSSISLPMQTAGIRHLRINGKNIDFNTDCAAESVIVRHYRANDTFAGEKRVAVTAGSAQVQMNEAVAPQDLLVFLPRQQSGAALVFTFTGAGLPRHGLPGSDSPRAKELWSHEITGKFYDLDVSADGRTAAAFGSTVQVYDPQGKPLWEKNYGGRVFYAKFSRRGDLLYVAAAGKREKEIAYNDVTIFCYDAAGRQSWAHLAGDGAVSWESRGRTVWDLQAGFDDNGVAYTEWTGQAIRLSPAGELLWAVAPGRAVTTSQIMGMRESQAVGLNTEWVLPAADGGALVVGGAACLRVDPQGRIQYLLQKEPTGPPIVTAGFDPKSETVGFAGLNLSAAVAGRLEGSSYIGRTARKVKVSDGGNYIAAGTSDGMLAVLDNKGKLLWQDEQRDSYVTEIIMLPGQKGLLVAREHFFYSPLTSWRYRESLTAYDFKGKPNWHCDGIWREQPFMVQMKLAPDRLIIATNQEVKAIDFKF